MEMALELGFNLDRVQANVRKAGLEDLLDRATVYRNGMEPAALELIDAELRARGIDTAEIAAHRERRAATIYGADGLAVKCGKCFRPAVARRWGWHCLWGVLPVFRRRLAFCDEHKPAAWREEVKLAPFGVSNASTSAWTMRVDGLSSCSLSQLMTEGI